MTYESNPSQKIPVHPLLAKIVGDRERPANAMALMGYLGPSKTEGRVTLYQRLADLSECFEIAFDDILTFEKAPESVLPNGGMIVWVKKGTVVDDCVVGRMKAILADRSQPNERRIAAAFGLGNFYDYVGRYDEAFGFYREANEMCRADARVNGYFFDLGELERRVDRAIENFTPEFFEQRAEWGITSDLPVFVLGLARSGTTLVEQILASHKLVFGAGELPHIPQIARKNKNALGWSRDKIDALAADQLSVLQSRGGDAKRVVDKNPGNIFCLGLIATLFPRARIICCHREPRDNVLSCYFLRFSLRMTFATDLADCARRHLETERMAAHWRRVLPIPMLDVQYEDLVADFEGQTRRLIEFIELPWDPNCLRFYETEREVNTPSFWQVRQPIYASSVGRWRNYERHLGPLLAVLSESHNKK